MKIRDFTKVFKALSNETRLRILMMLMERECCVCEVMQALDISQTRASRNLRILENAELVKSRRDGTWVVYSIEEQTMSRYSAPLPEMLKDFLGSEEIISQDKERLSYARRIGPEAAERLRRKD